MRFTCRTHQVAVTTGLENLSYDTMKTKSKSRKPIIIGIGFFLLLMLCFVIVLQVQDDEHLILPTDISLYAPVPKNGTASYELLVEFTNLEFDFVELDYQPTNFSEERKTWLIDNEAAIMANYAIVQTAFPMLEQLAAFDEIADLCEDFTNQLLDLTILLKCVKAVIAYTKLTLVHGHNDKGLKELMCFNHVFKSFLKHTRPFVHTVAAAVGTDLINNTLAIIADVLSHSERAYLIQELAEPFDYLSAYERSSYVEYCFSAYELDRLIAEQHKNDESFSLLPVFQFKKRSTSILDLCRRALIS